MNEVSLAGLGFDPDHYVPLKIGSSIIGWTPTCDRLVEDQHADRGKYFIVGDEVVIAGRGYQWGLGDSGPFSYYTGEVILNLPPRSVVFDENETFALYSEQNRTTLHEAMNLYTHALHIHLQAELHKRSPHEVMDLLLALMNYDYPDSQLNELSWRGKALVELLRESKASHLYVSDLGPLDMRAKDLNSRGDEITDFFALQAVWVKNKLGGEDIKRVFNPSNVFLVTVSQDDEFLSKLLFTEANLTCFVKNSGRPINPKRSTQFFLCEEGDPIMDWTKGTTISLSELHDVVSQDTLDDSEGRTL